MSTGSAIAVALTFVWLGMVLAISFLETPLKFRAPGITVPLGLGIGRLVFRALNVCELALAAVVTASFAFDRPPIVPAFAVALAVVALLAQVLVIRPALTRRSDAVLAGRDGPRSRAHWFYIGLEIGKVAALLTAGVTLLA